VGYDVDFIRVAGAATSRFPVDAASTEPLLADAMPFDDPDVVREQLLAIDGMKPALDGALDYLGRGLSYARLIVTADAVRVDNNLNATELLRIYNTLRRAYPDLVIRDRQSGQLHDADSFADWWSRPLS